MLGLYFSLENDFPFRRLLITNLIDELSFFMETCLVANRRTVLLVLICSCLSLYVLNLLEWTCRERMSIELISPSMKTSQESLIGHPCLLFPLGYLIQTPKIFLSLIFVSLRTTVFSPIYQEAAVSSDPQRGMISLLASFCTHEVVLPVLLLIMEVLLRCLYLNWSLFLLWATLLTCIYAIILLHVTITKWHSFCKHHLELQELLLETSDRNKIHLRAIILWKESKIPVIGL